MIQDLDVDKPLSYLQDEDIEKFDIEKAKKVLEAVNQINLSTLAKSQIAKSKGEDNYHFNVKSFYYSKVKRRLKARIDFLKSEERLSLKRKKQDCLKQENHNLRYEISQLKRKGKKYDSLIKLNLDVVLKKRNEEIKELKKRNHEMISEIAKLKKQVKSMKDG